jgi:hypothetical protein
MQRTKYFNQTRPSDTQLNWTESSRSDSILRRFRSIGQMGIVSGFQISPNTLDATKVDIAGGEGYTGGNYLISTFRGTNSGERISTETSAVTGSVYQTNLVTQQGLADYTNGTKNYISVLYAEDETYPLSERTYPFTQRNTVVTETYTISVLTETQWNLLDADDFNNRILIGIVTAQGPGNAITSANIDQFVQPKSHPHALNPTSLEGITITGIADSTSLGAGTLRWSASSNMLYWTAPGDNEGAGVSIPNSGTYTLYSNTTTYWVALNVVFGNLPSIDTTETIYVQSLYGRNVPMACAIDQAHRDMTGSGAVTSTNPHGLTLDDIEGGTFEHADLFHKNGISSDAESTQLLASIDAANDSIDIQNKGTMRNSFLIDGVARQTITGVAAGTDASLAFDITPALDSGDYLIYIDSAGEPQYVKIAQYAPSDAADDQVLFSANLEIWDMVNASSGSGTLSFNTTTKLMTWKAPGDAVAGTAVYIVEDTAPDFYKIYSSDTDNWILIKVTGAIGGSGSSTFAIDKNETEHPEDSILKIAVVTWNAIGDIHFNLRDIRSFFTSDIKDAFEREHDSDGLHTKPLQDTLTIGTDNTALYASVQTNVAVLGYAAAAYGVYGQAGSASGVYGAAGTNRGVVGYAPDIAGSFSAATDDGVIGVAARNNGVVGIASYAGGTFSATNLGMQATAVTDTAGRFLARSIGVEASVTAAYGVSATAPGIAVFATAQNQGVKAEVASNTAVSASAATAYGVFATASSVGVIGNATNVGVAGIAANASGVYGSAPNSGMKGIAETNYGVYGSAAGLYGVRGIASQRGGDFEATDSYGVCGVADNIAGYLSALAASTALWLDAGLLRYDVGFAAAGALHSYVPVEIDGVQYKVAVYSNA